MENFLELEQTLSLKRKRKKNNLTRMRINYKYKYFEKNTKNLHSFIFKNLEIKHYLQKILKDQNINLHNQNINLSESGINLFLPVHETEQTLINLKKNKSKQIKKSNKLNKKLKILKKEIKKYYTQKQLKSAEVNKIKISRLYKSSLWKFYMSDKNLIKNIKKFNNLSNERFLENISLFTNYKLNVYLKTKQINNIEDVNNIPNNRYKKPKIKQILLKLRRFERNPFFKEGKHILTATQYNSANLLANFISKQLRTIKRHNFFLSFLKESLSIIVVNQKDSKIRGIKLIIKGRLNNAARSKHKIITLGKIGLITNKFHIDYAESTAFTSNGTIGVKVWVCKKEG